MRFSREMGVWVGVWQVLDLAMDGDRLTYRAYDQAGRVRDEFVIDKSGLPPVATTPTR